MLGEAILGDLLPLGDVDGAGEENPITLAWEAETGRVFLYEVTAFNRGLAGTWFDILGTIPLGSLPPGETISGEGVLRFSDAGYISHPGDSVSSELFDGIVEDGLRISRSIPATPEAERRVNLDVGSFTLLNADGTLDDAVRGYSVDGRPVRVLLGLDSYRYDIFTPIFTGRAVQWNNNLSTVRIVVRDETYRLEVPLQVDLYDGSGGYNGGDDLAGRPRPICFGKVLNISPPMIDATNLIYQVHHRDVSAIDAVYDRGASITPGSDYPDYAALVAAVVSGGTYATCLALGLFRLGSAPSGLVTADVHGDADTGYVETTGEIGLRILEEYAQVGATKIDSASWANFTAAVPGVIGWWQAPQQITITAALSDILGHCNAWWGADYNGVYQVGRIAEPDASMSVLDLDYGVEPFDPEIIDPLPGTFPPRFRQSVGYQKNWTPQQETDLAGTVTAARRQFLAESVRVMVQEDLTLSNSFLMAVEAPILESLFDADTDADELAEQLLEIYKRPRQTLRIPLSLRGLSARLGYSVLVTHPRINAGTPTPMLCMGVSISADNRSTELVLWG